MGVGVGHSYTRGNREGVSLCIFCSCSCSKLRPAASLAPSNSSCHSRHRLSSLTNQQSDLLQMLHPTDRYETSTDRSIESPRVESSASFCVGAEGLYQQLYTRLHVRVFSVHFFSFFLFCMIYVYVCIYVSVFFCLTTTLFT